MIFHFWWKTFDHRIKIYTHLYWQKISASHICLHCSGNEYCTMAEPKMLLNIVSTDKCKMEWLNFENIYIFINFRKSGTTLTIFLDYSRWAHTSHGTRIIHLTEKTSSSMKYFHGQNQNTTLSMKHSMIIWSHSTKRKHNFPFKFTEKFAHQFETSITFFQIKLSDNFNDIKIK